MGNPYPCKPCRTTNWIPYALPLRRQHHQSFRCPSDVGARVAADPLNQTTCRPTQMADFYGNCCCLNAVVTRLRRIPQSSGPPRPTTGRDLVVASEQGIAMSSFKNKTEGFIACLWMVMPGLISRAGSQPSALRRPRQTLGRSLRNPGHASPSSQLVARRTDPARVRWGCSRPGSNVLGQVPGVRRSPSTPPDMPAGNLGHGGGRDDRNVPRPGCWFVLKDGSGTLRVGHQDGRIRRPRRSPCIAAFFRFRPTVDQRHRQASRRDRSAVPQSP